MVSVMMNTTELKTILMKLEDKGLLQVYGDLDESLLQMVLPTKSKGTRRAPARQSTMANQCIARVYKDGEGLQCSRSSKLGDFCGFHGRNSKRTKPCPDERCAWYGLYHDKVWEHHGRWDEPAPGWFKNADTCWSGVEKEKWETMEKTKELLVKFETTDLDKITDFWELD